MKRETIAQLKVIIEGLEGTVKELREEVASVNAERTAQRSATPNLVLKLQSQNLQLSPYPMIVHRL